MPSPKITLARKSGSKAFIKNMLGVGRLAAYVGVPAATAQDRADQLLEMAGASKKGGKRRKQLEKAAKTDVNNAELLFIHTKGSPVRNIPARPVLQPAIEAEDNKERIVKQLDGMIQAQLAGDREGAEKGAARAALAGQNAARKWFTDPRNNWAPNKPGTIERKGSDKPLIDTGALRASIQGLVGEE